jgi:hypothetical protein
MTRRASWRTVVAVRFVDVRPPSSSASRRAIGVARGRCGVRITTVRWCMNTPGQRCEWWVCTRPGGPGVRVAFAAGNHACNTILRTQDYRNKRMRRFRYSSGIFVVVALTPYAGWHTEAKEWTDRVARSRVGRAVRASGEDVGVGLASLVLTLQATGVTMANATFLFMREILRCEMMRTVGAKAVASVEMADGSAAGDGGGRTVSVRVNPAKKRASRGNL